MMLRCGRRESVHDATVWGQEAGIRCYFMGKTTFTVARVQGEGVCSLQCGERESVHVIVWGERVFS